MSMVGILDTLAVLNQASNRLEKFKPGTDFKLTIEVGTSGAVTLDLKIGHEQRYMYGKIDNDPSGQALSELKIAAQSLAEVVRRAFGMG